MTTLLSRSFQLAVLFNVWIYSPSLLTMQRRSTFLSGGVAYALYSYKVTRASQLLYMYMHT